MKTLPLVRVRYGSDPEGFFSRNGVIIGSEKVLPQRGLKNLTSSIVLDGVQFEMHPLPCDNVFELGMNVSQAFKLLQSQLKKNPTVKLCWQGVVEVERAELDSLSEESRILGCKPSLNFYGITPIDVDPLTYRKRSAGGHIHLALWNTKIMTGGGLEDRRHGLVPFLDTFVGNLCVLLDRDPNAAERRENYGRAGEYRLPNYGREYRTLSNFWLRNYSLMSLAFGMAGVATSAYNSSLNGVPLDKELVRTIDIEKVVKAINTNDFNLAMENLLALRPFIENHLDTGEFPLNRGNVDKFIAFATKVKEGGLEQFFPEDPLTHWTGKNPKVDFNTFLEKL